MRAVTCAELWTAAARRQGRCHRRVLALLVHRWRTGLTGGYRRFACADGRAACRAWFTDRNGNLWAVVGCAGREPVGAGGAGFAVRRARCRRRHREPSGLGPRRRRLRRPARRCVARSRRSISSGRSGFTPARRVAVAAFCEEEGGRFGVACLGRRLLTGAYAGRGARAARRGRRDAGRGDGRPPGHDPDGLGADEELLASVGAVRRAAHRAGQRARRARRRGRDSRGHLAARPLAARLRRRAEPRRAPPGWPTAAIRCCRTRPRCSRPGRRLPRTAALATFGKVTGGAGRRQRDHSAVSAWLDARAPTKRRSIALSARSRPPRGGPPAGVEVGVRRESFDPGVSSTPRCGTGWPRRSRPGMQAPVLPTGAGHDAGVLAARLPAAMLFVRNPTGVSHSPAEHAELADCEAGVAALAAVLAELAGGSSTAARPGTPSWPGSAGQRRRAADVLIEATGDRFTAVTPDVPPADPEARAPTSSGWPDSPCPAWRTRTRTPSTARCAAAPRWARARSGPGASRCTRPSPGWTRTPTWSWRPASSRRWRWPGSPASASSTTCTTARAARRTPIRTRWATR